MQKDKAKKTHENERVVKTPKPKEQYGLHFSSSLKITDTGTGKVILRMRCD